MQYILNIVKLIWLIEMSDIKMNKTDKKEEEDLYMRMKDLESQLEILQI